MGQVYYDMGFLSSVGVVECSASDLIGQYVGQTGPKTKKMLEKALGQVLFVDEAYRLGEGHFAKEAMDELVGLLTQERFIGKIVVILAGYDQDMNRLMGVNPGLSSRFPETIMFHNMSPPDCLTLLDDMLVKNGVRVASLRDPSSVEYLEMEDLVAELSRLASWGNARDITTLSAQMTNLAFANAAQGSSGSAEVGLSMKNAIGCIQKMLTERQERETNVSSRIQPKSSSNIAEVFNGPDLPSPPTIIQDAMKPIVKLPNLQGSQHLQRISEQRKQRDTSEERDPGVTDAVWHQLKVDNRMAIEAEKKLEAEILELQKALQVAARCELKEADDARTLAEAQLQTRNAAEREELKRKHEEARLREVLAAGERQRKADEFRRKKEEEERRKKQEATVQTKLRSMGVCVAGFRWIRSNGGYRCAGGSHFVTNAALGIDGAEGLYE